MFQKLSIAVIFISVLVRMGEIGDRQICLEKEGCSCGKTGESSVACKNNQVCLFLNTKKFTCVDELIYNRQRCVGNFCGCGREDSDANKDMLFSICETNQFCVIFNAKPSCVGDLILPNMDCGQSAKTCLCFDSGEPSPQGSEIICQNDQRCVAEIKILSCVSRDIQQNEMCLFENKCTCRLTENNIPTSSTVCEKGQFCSSFNSNPVCVASILNPGQFCLNDEKCLCRDVVQNKASSNVQCQKSEVCFYDKNEPSCVASKILDEALCTSESCACSKSLISYSSNDKLCINNQSCYLVDQDMRCAGEVILLGLECTNPNNCICRSSKDSTANQAFCSKTDHCLDGVNGPLCVPQITNKIKCDNVLGCLCIIPNPKDKGVKSVRCGHKSFCAAVDGSAVCIGALSEMGTSCKLGEGCLCKLAHGKVSKERVIAKTGETCFSLDNKLIAAPIRSKSYQKFQCMNREGCKCAFYLDNQPTFQLCRYSEMCKLDNEVGAFCFSSERTLMLSNGDFCPDKLKNCNCSGGIEKIHILDKCSTGQECTVTATKSGTQAKCIAKYDHFPCRINSECKCGIFAKWKIGQTHCKLESDWRKKNSYVNLSVETTFPTLMTEKLIEEQFKIIFDRLPKKFEKSSSLKNLKNSLTNNSQVFNKKNSLNNFDNVNQSISAKIPQETNIQQNLQVSVIKENKKAEVNKNNLIGSSKLKKIVQNKIIANIKNFGTSTKKLQRGQSKENLNEQSTSNAEIIQKGFEGTLKVQDKI